MPSTACCCRFETHVFFLRRQPVDTPLPPHVRSHFLPESTSMTQLQTYVAEQRLDVLVYNDVNMDPVTYLLAFSRLAHVQCLTLNNGITSGIEHSVDFFLSSEDHHVLDAQSESSAGTDYLERLLLFPGSHTYFAPPAVNDADLPSRAALGLPTVPWYAGGPILVVCVQALMKIHVTMDDAIVEIVTARSAAAGGAKLVIISKGRTHGLLTLLTRLGDAAHAARGMDPAAFVRDHVVVLEYLGREEFAALLSYADVVLDTFPFGGGATSLQSFRYGGAVVTLPADHRSGYVTGDGDAGRGGDDVEFADGST